MTKLRRINVLIAGEVRRPGSFNISALSTLSQALYVAGGITDIGAYRDVQLKRSGKLVGKLDLYNLLLRGDNSQDKQLQSGDVVFVPVAKALVSIDGEFARPAIYEVAAKDTLDDMVEMAGGILPYGRYRKSTVETLCSRRLCNLDSRPH